VHIGGLSLSPEIGLDSTLSMPEVEKDTHRKIITYVLELSFQYLPGISFVACTEA